MTWTFRMVYESMLSLVQWKIPGKTICYNQWSFIIGVLVSRFSPVARSELTNLQVSVSILCQFEDGLDWTDWDLGTHGIRIEWYSERGNRKTATFLPEVPLSQGWDKTQTIDSLLRKGGFKGVVTPDVRRSIRLVRYQSEMITVTYQDYVHHCRWQTSN